MKSLLYFLKQHDLQIVLLQMWKNGHVRAKSKLLREETENEGEEEVKEINKETESNTTRKRKCDGL